MKKYLRNPLKKAIKLTTSTAKEVLSQTIDGIDEGINTPEQITARKARNEATKIAYEREVEISKKKDEINYWAFLLFVTAEFSILCQYIVWGQFKNGGFENMLSDRGVVMLIPFLGLVLVGVLSREIAKNLK